MWGEANLPSSLAGEGGSRRLTDEGSTERLRLISIQIASGATPHPTRFAGPLLPQGEKDS
jgi:hypothetical protein